MKVERHFKTEELATMLGLSADTLRRAAQKGEIKAVRPRGSRELLWPESEVERWLVEAYPAPRSAA